MVHPDWHDSNRRGTPTFCTLDEEDECPYDTCGAHCPDDKRTEDQRQKDREEGYE